MILDFREIPEANSSQGLQDTFELFSRDFLEHLGFTIKEIPNRGADGKKDFVVNEIRKGIGGNSSINWLVSCKHYAKSGKSISDNEEPDILDRVRKFSCDGFLGIYSTIPATSLAGKLEGLKSDFESLIFDRENIEKNLLDSKKGILLAKRYFPKSMEIFLKEIHSPAEIFAELPEILCLNCGQNILRDGKGMYIELQKHHQEPKLDMENWEIEDIYFSCVGAWVVFSSLCK